MSEDKSGEIKWAPMWPLWAIPLAVYIGGWIVAAICWQVFDWPGL